MSGSAVYRGRHTQHGRGDARGERRRTARPGCDGFVARAARPGHDDRRDQERLRADRATTRRGCSRLARDVTDETTFLGAHVVPAEYADDPDAYVDLVTGPMLDACAPHARWIDVFCETGAFTVEQSRRILDGRRRARARRAGARQPARPGRRRRRSPVELDAASVDHCTYLTDADVARAGRVEHRRHAAARRRVLDPPAVPGCAAPARRGRHRRARERLQPRLVVHVVDAVLHRRRRARHGDDSGRGAAGRRPPAARRRCAGRTSATSRVGARADLVVLRAPTYVHLAYRPGVPLVRPRPSAPDPRVA